MSIKSCSSCEYWMKPNWTTRCNLCTNFSDWKSDTAQELKTTLEKEIYRLEPLLKQAYDDMYGPTRQMPSMPMVNLSDLQNKQIQEAVNKLNGKKFDSDKLDWTLMPWKELEEVLEILEFGAKKYSRDNWKHVEPTRYEKAAMRHLISYVTGEKKDLETNKSHLAHLICNALFLMWNDNDEKIPRDN